MRMTTDAVMPMVVVRDELARAMAVRMAQDFGRQRKRGLRE